MAKEVKETAKQRRARTSKFKSNDPHARPGNFEISALFSGTLKPQLAPFNNLGGAIARLQRLLTNPDIRVVKIIEHVTSESGKRAVTIHQFVRAGHQEFTNGKSAWWESRV